MTSQSGGNDSPRQRSVFANVDQSVIIAKIEKTTSDDENSTFFDGSLHRDGASAALVFEAGVQALAGEGTQTPRVRQFAQERSDSTKVPSHPVYFTEAVPAAREAKNAFILYGPRGVRR